MTGHFTPTEITLKELPDSAFKVLVDDDLTFVDAADERWTAPLGTWTDGASVPRLALGVTDGRFEKMFLKAAVVHDAYCQTENEDRRPPYRSRPWQEVHRMFHDACIAGGTPRMRARLMYSAVSWFGPRWDDPTAEARQVPPDLAQVGFAGTKQWIETAEPGLAEIEADVADREGEIMGIYRLQAAALTAIQGRDYREAADKLEEADARLAARLALAPDDLMLLDLQGYQHKNWAMIRPAGKQEELDEAERLFRHVIEVEPRDASAINGLGSVAILRDDLDEAERLILEALELEPTYRAAQHDLDLVHRIRTSRSRSAK